MKVYKVVDDSTPLPLVTDLAELGKLFVKLSKKYPDVTSYWVEEETI